MSFLGDIIQAPINLMKGGGARKGAEASVENITNQAYDRGRMTGAESEQYNTSFDIGKLVEQLYKYQMGIGDAPVGYDSPELQYQKQTGELGKTLFDTTLRDIKDPYATYESTLQPQLKAAEDYINSQMQKRGLLSSGLNIENMGRAGIDLAIAEADKRMQYRADALTRAAGLSDTIQSTGQNNLTNLTNLYNNQQTFGLDSMKRQAGMAAEVLPYQVAPQFARLSDAYAQINAGRKQMSSAIDAGTDPSNTINLGLSAFKLGK